MELHITGDPAADKLLSDDAFALLTGMLLDQQVTMESAFAGPEKLRTRIGSMDPTAIAAYDPQEFVGVRRLDRLDGPGRYHGLGPVATGRSRLDQSENDPM